MQSEEDGGKAICPFYLDHHTKSRYVDPETMAAALEFSKEVDAESFLEGMLEKDMLNGNVVLVGDSLTRQNFIALGCLLHKEGLADQHYIAWPNNGGLRQFNDARIQFSRNGKTNNFYFHPTAGLVNSYDWGFELYMSPMHGEEDWLQSCRDRKPFFLDTYTTNQDVEPHNERLAFDKADEHFEKVALGGDDVIVLNAGFHSGRKDNLNKIVELADCMKEARANLEAPDWPSVLYMRTSQQHFMTENGAYPTNGETPECMSLEQSKNLQDPYLAEEIEMLFGKIPIIGKDMNINHPHLHVSNERDCSHWAMPGVPSIFVKEIMHVFSMIKGE